MMIDGYTTSWGFVPMTIIPTTSKRRGLGHSSEISYSHSQFGIERTVRYSERKKVSSAGRLDYIEKRHPKAACRFSYLLPIIMRHIGHVSNGIERLIRKSRTTKYYKSQQKGVSAYVSRKGRRMMQTDRVIAKRLRLVREVYPESREFYQRLANQPHRLAKKHPFDCGQSQCFWCHMDKLNGIPSYRDRRTSSR